MSRECRTCQYTIDARPCPFPDGHPKGACEERRQYVPASSSTDERENMKLVPVYGMHRGCLPAEEETQKEQVQHD